MEIPNFLTDDWKKIPQNLRYVFIVGVLLIFNSWLLDHWFNTTQVYYFWGLDIRYLGYSIGLTLIIACFILIIVKQFYLFSLVWWYRQKYSMSKLDKTYHLLWFNGKLMLFDNNSKFYYHVYPWETAQDLLFVSKGWYLSVGFDPGKEYLVDEKTIFKTKKYKNGGSLNTQK